MEWKTFLIYLLVMACVTYLIRMIPLAAIRGRGYVIPDDIKELAVPVLAHRVILRGMHSGMTAESFIKGVLAAVPAPTEARA